MGHEELNSDQPYCDIKENELPMLLFQNKGYAEKERPEFRPATNDIEEVYKKVASTHPEFLHSNLKEITLWPWGAKEFALKADTNVCIIT